MSDKPMQFLRLTQKELEDRLSEVDLSNEAFCRLTGVAPKTLRRWFLHDDDRNALEPPFWVTSWLLMYDHMHDRGDHEKIHQLSDECLIPADAA